MFESKRLNDKLTKLLDDTLGLRRRMQTVEDRVENIAQEQRKARSHPNSAPRPYSVYYTIGNNVNHGTWTGELLGDTGGVSIIDNEGVVVAYFPRSSLCAVYVQQ